MNEALYVGVAGFEPATSSSQTRRDNRATLHPEFLCVEGEGFEPSVQLPVRQFSKLLVSATHPPLQRCSELLLC